MQLLFLLAAPTFHVGSAASRPRRTHAHECSLCVCLYLCLYLCACACVYVCGCSCLICAPGCLCARGWVYIPCEEMPLSCCKRRAARTLAWAAREGRGKRRKRRKKNYFRFCCNIPRPLAPASLFEAPPDPSGIPASAKAVLDATVK